MAAHDHDRFADSAELYVIGALPPDERTAFEAHARECPECLAELRALRPVITSLPLGLPQVDPPASLRARVLANATGHAAAGVPTPEPMRRRLWSNPGWLAAAALFVTALGLGAVAWSARQRLAAVESRLAVLTAADLKQVTLAGQPPAPGASGRGFLSRSRGIVFAASNLPPLPSGRTYQLWYLTPGAPVSAGLFKPDAAGDAVLSLTPPPASITTNGLAVSIEPDGGVVAPTGAIYLAGTSQ